ncbi:MAG: carboxypeptidase regulatory-like domain-containing protein [Gemmatimonadales bacterium]
MNQTWSLAARTSLAAVAAFTFSVYPLAAQQAPVSGSLSGTVTDESGKPIADATISVSHADGTSLREVTSTSSGVFSLRELPSGLYKLRARRIGYREAVRQSLRITAGQTADVRITLATSATQLSTVIVTVSPTAIDPTTADIARRIEIADVKLVPMSRDAAGVVDLLPGARKGFLWGGAGSAANNYQLDGVGVNHPGVGGNFLDPSIDWIETVEVRGLGAGAEYGSFQGGLINAITKTGSNTLQGAFRANYVSPALSGSNIHANEEGAQQIMRREFSGDVRGPLVRDRVFYFLAAQIIDRGIQLSDLTTAAETDFRSAQQEHRDVRGIAKITFAPGLRDRIDLLAGANDNRVHCADLNGIDDVAAARRLSSPTRYFAASWTRTGVTTSLDARVGGFSSRASRLGQKGDSVPALELFSTGRIPVYQNSAFNERVKPMSISANLTWKKKNSFSRGENQVVVGTEYTRGHWSDQKTRNGGLTWYPYVNQSTGSVDPTRPLSWLEVGSAWGGEVRIKSDVEDGAVFVQDYLTLLPNLTFTPGVRYGRWKGWLTPSDSTQSRFLAAQHQAFDPRFGVAWDVSGRNSLVLKAHWGRYHQGMNSVLFDRAEGADSYSNERFYFQGPTLSDSRKVFTPSQRDENLNRFTGFSPEPSISILNEAGRVVNYRQPYVDQTILSLEKNFGPRWKLELAYTNRLNKDIVGLIDRNLDNNYSAFRDVRVRGRIGNTQVFDQFAKELVFPQILVSNEDIRNELIRRRDFFPVSLPPLPGFQFRDIDRLTFVRDIVLTTIDGAKRRFDQVSVSLRTEHSRWNGFGAISFTRHYGNVAGLTGFGTTGTSFSAGPWVRPNEKPHMEGLLPEYSAVETKAWFTGKLLYGFSGGAFATFSSGEHYTPNFTLTPRFSILASDRTILPDVVLTSALGQTFLLEDRGSRKYPAHGNLDLRIERRFKTPGFAWILTGDLFNALGSDAIVQRNLSIDDYVSTDPSSVFAAPRRRVDPVALQLGGRIEF